MDLGCSGGPDNIFIEFHNSEIPVCYNGYDFNDQEINRLREKYPTNFKFHSKKIVTDRQIKPDQNWFEESSAGQAHIEADMSSYTEKQVVDNNLWGSNLVKKSRDELYIRQILEVTQTNINLLKIDLDGPDFGYLQDFFSSVNYLPQFVSLEINYQGSGNSKSNTFHNTDRYMKDLGYDLMAITSRTYSNKVLPSRFQYNIFAQTLKGIPLQGDALYFKMSKYNSVEDILRDVILLDAFNLEDSAARIILENSSFIDGKESTGILNALTKEVWGDTFESYDALMKMWEENKEYFFPESPKLSIQTTTDFTQIRIKKIVQILFKKLLKKIFVNPFLR
jgi:hypothetical protein